MRRDRGEGTAGAEGARRPRAAGAATALGEPDDILAGIKAPAYNVKLENFEGPLDLLLHLIQRDEFDIFNIPIARLAEEYLAEVRRMELLDLQVAGEFLVMAATLLRIKARMLLPRQEDEEAVEEEDPRGELVHRLLEYREFKRAAQELAAREERRRSIFGRALPPGERIVEEELLRNATLFDLASAYRTVLERAPRFDSFEVILDEITLEDRIAEILVRLDGAGRLAFAEFLEQSARRIHAVVTFIALLELARLGKVSLVQAALFEPIWVEQRVP